MVYLTYFLKLYKLVTIYVFKLKNIYTCIITISLPLLDVPAISGYEGIRYMYIQNNIHV